MHCTECLSKFSWLMMFLDSRRHPWRIKKKSGRRRNVYKIIKKKRIMWKMWKQENEEKLNDIDIQWSIIIRSDEICSCFFAPINRDSLKIDGFKSFAENCRNNARCVPSSDCVWTKWKWTNGKESFANLSQFITPLRQLWLIAF